MIFYYAELPEKLDAIMQGGIAPNPQGVAPLARDPESAIRLLISEYGLCQCERIDLDILAVDVPASDANDLFILFADAPELAGCSFVGYKGTVPPGYICSEYQSAELEALNKSAD